MERRWAEWDKQQWERKEREKAAPPVPPAKREHRHPEDLALNPTQGSKVRHKALQCKESDEW